MTAVKIQHACLHLYYRLLGCFEFLNYPRRLDRAHFQESIYSPDFLNYSIIIKFIIT
jgi:hypothetical protein